MSAKGSVLLTIVDICQSKIREEKNKYGKTKQELQEDIDIFRALGDTCMTLEQYNEINAILNAEFEE